MNLQFYNEKFKEQLNAFSLVEEQHQFTALPAEALEIIDESRFPVVMVENHNAVGFFVLHRGEAIRDYSEHPDAILLRAFSVDEIHQGKGYAKQAMRLLPGFIKGHFPEKTEIVLAVNERNLAARSLYLKCGFKDHGKKLMGKKGWQSILTFQLT
ncbi:GNAT family N-acetyltransferase [Bacillus sp. SCS-153A]|uniref:GNAT family N-acetyltransferase n=1 Tax=Rossellomorea sedimentorum TaxID=3115294 RepID=UPI0039068553